MALGSLHHQGTAFTVTVVDDGSPDPAAMQREVERFTGWKRRRGAGGRQAATLIVRSERGGELASVISGMTRLIALGARDTDVVCHLCGDDWLPDNALRFLTYLYVNPSVWLTYGQYRTSEYRIGHCAPVNTTVAVANAWRTGPWVTSHMRAYRVGLWKQIPKEHLTDPTTGRPWFYGTDLAMMYPMLEMAGPEHAAFNEVPIYVYRVYDGNVQPSQYDDCCRRVRALPPLAPIASLGGAVEGVAPAE